MKKQLLTGALAASTLVTASFLQAAPAQALSFGNGSVTVNSGDVGQSFFVNFDGNVNETNVPGLSSQATFTFNGFNAVSGLSGVTEAAFTVLLRNTSSIASRTSALGFDVVSQTLRGVGNAGGEGNTRVSGLFSNDRSGQFPNQFGDIEVCFTNGNTCQGGASGGVFNTDDGETFNLVLALNSANVNSLTLINFGVRYQSITGNGFNDDSGTGQGTPTPIPTPALVPAALGMGAALLRKKKQEEAEKA